MDHKIHSIRSLVFLIHEETAEILLAVKKKVFGGGFLNGYGGSLKEEDCGSIKKCAARESFEEGDVIIVEDDLEEVAQIEFIFPQENEKWNQLVHVFLAKKWGGIPKETDEMGEPKWFPLGKIPYETMWPDDALWLPKVLKGEKVKARVYFKDTKGNVEKIEFA